MNLAHSQSNDKYDITKTGPRDDGQTYESPDRARKPMKNPPANLVKDKVEYTVFDVEGDAKSVMLEAVYYLPMIFREKVPKQVLPEGKRKQEEEFQKKAEIELNRRTKRIIKMKR